MALIMKQLLGTSQPSSLPLKIVPGAAKVLNPSLTNTVSVPGGAVETSAVPDVKFTKEQIFKYYHHRFKGKLNEKNATSEGWMSVRCPFHHDANPSFGLNILHGGFTCHSTGCDSGSGDIYMFEMLFSGTDFPTAKATVHHLMTIETTYVYTDENGSEAHYVERIDSPGADKQLKQYHKTDEGKVPGLPKGTKLYPYHMPEVVKAHSVFVAEGEKCADFVRAVLASAGVTDIAVTTFCGGSNGWKDCYAPYFQGKKVILFTDHDENGYKFIYQVAKGIQSLVQSLQMVNIPVPQGIEAAGYDIYDFLCVHGNSWDSSNNMFAALQTLIQSAIAIKPEEIVKQAHLFFFDTASTSVQPQVPPLSTVANNGVPPMPEDCMYGWAGECAKELGTPPSLAYPAMLAACSVMPGVEPTGLVRSNLYTCLIGPKGGAKSETQKRAVTLAGLDTQTLIKLVPGSDRGLYKLIGSDGPEGKKVLLLQDELRNTLSKIGIQGSSLAPTLCSLWCEDTAGSADKSGKHPVNCRLTILGALKADDPGEFAEVFGSKTNEGLVDRFIFGLSVPGWKFTPWQKGKMTPAKVVQSEVSKHSWDKMCEWRNAKPDRNPRLGEQAMRIAHITSRVNGDEWMTDAALEAACRFCEWQETIAAHYKAGFAETLDGKCTEAILNALEGKKGMAVKWNVEARNKHWYQRFGAPTLGRCRDGLFREGVIGYDNKTGRIWLPE